MNALQRQSDVLLRRQVGIKVELLEDKADAAAQLAQALPLSRLVGLPSIRISPPLKDSSWLIKRISVDFPEPEGPRIATTSPGSTCRLMALST